MSGSQADYLDPLRERESTSLWKYGEKDDMYVSSYEGAGRPLLDDYENGNHPEVRTPCLQIQLVKKRTSTGSQPYYEAIIGGMKSEGSISTNGTVEHKLCTHHGWEMDPLTHRYVVSPCVVSVFVEDGERVPQRCEVSILMSKPLSKEEPMFLGNKEIKPFSAKDDAYQPLVTVYPSRHPPPFRVSFNDYGRVYQYEARQLTENSTPFVKTLGKMIIGEILRSWNYQLFFNKLFDDDRAKALGGLVTKFIANYIFGTAGAAATTATALSGGLAMVASLMAFPLIGAGLYSIVSATEDSMGSTLNTESQKMRDTRVQIGVIAETAFFGVTGVNDTNKKAVDALNKLFAQQPTDPSGQTWSFFGSSGKNGEYQPNDVFDFLGSSVLTIGSTIEKYIKRKPEKDPVKVSFTLEEFATSINVLAYTTGSKSWDIRTKQETAQFHVKYRRQLIIWQWLQDPESDTSVFLKLEKSAADGFNRRVNPLDTSECNIDREFSIRTFLDIKVEDSDICQKDHETIHRFSSDRTDDALLGAIASNELEKIEQVNTAILNLVDALKAAIKRTKETRTSFFKGLKDIATDLSDSAVTRVLQTVFNVAYFSIAVPFYEQMISFPILKKILSSPNKEKLSVKQRTREVVSLLDANETLYKRILESIPSKLQQHFHSDVYSQSVGKLKLESAISKNNSLVSKCPPPPQPDPTPPDPGSSSTPAPDPTTPDPGSSSTPAPDPTTPDPGSSSTPAPDPTTPDPGSSSTPAAMTVEAFFDAIKNISTTINFDLNYNKKNESYKLIRRYLPHTAKSVAFLFPRVAVSESNSVYFTNEFITVRETSNIQDAILAYNSYSANAVAAFRNLNLSWTENQERPFELVHYHSDNDQLRKTLGTKKIQSLIDCFALQLNPPSDIFELLSQEVGTESILRRVETLSKKELYHGFPNSWEYVLALKFYAEVVTMELIKRHQHTDWQRVTFSTRNIVDSIAEDCANFVLKSYSDGRISSFSWSDPATFATETRIYTQLLMSRIHAFRDANNGTATALKMVASALKNIARSKKLDWQAIPSEQLASLRVSYKHGEIAFERVSKVLTDTRSDLASHALSLSTASYPVLLLERGEPPEEERWKQDGNEPFLAVGTTPSWIGAREPTEDDLTILRMRFESLRINFDTDGKEGIERRLEALSVSNVSTPLEYGHFFVPFTYGDHLPTLSSNIVPAFMFSSVPVSCKSVINAIDKTIQSLSVKPQAPLLELVPSFTRCRSMEAAYVIDNPSEIVYDKDRIRFLCSYVENEDTNVPKQTSTKTAEESANSAFMNTFTESLSDVYSSIAWNAERVQQSILLARSCNGNKDVFFDIRLPSSKSTEFGSPLQPQLEKERRSIKAEILYHTRVCIYSIRREVVKLAIEANAIFVKQIKAKSALGIVAEATSYGARIQRHDVADVPVWSDDDNSQVVAPSIATGDQTPTTPIDEYLLFSTKILSDDDIEAYTMTISEKSFSFVRKLSEREYDFRNIVRDFGSTETTNWLGLPDWIFQPQKGLLKDGVDKDNFNFTVGGKTLELDDIKDDEKSRLLTETLLNFEAIFRLEAPFRMVDYLLSKLDDVEMKLSKAKEVQKNPDDIHSVVFRRNFTASVVIGQAMSFDVLGETKSPSLSRMQTGSESLTYDGISNFEADDLSKRLERLKTKVNDASKTIATLRLSELCAITHTTLSE